MEFNQLLLVAFLVESLIQTIKPLYDRSKGWNLDSLIALVIGIGFCYIVKVNLFSIVDFNLDFGDPVINHSVGVVLTGVIASRGSNFAHDLLKFVQKSAMPTLDNAVG
ncbi:MAG TPA: hypothetical protein VJZ78_05360 [Anaerolineales bacterium]|nr:hypothetical protein [Anaerolineales bacterium]